MAQDAPIPAAPGPAQTLSPEQLDLINAEANKQRALAMLLQGAQAPQMQFSPSGLALAGSAAAPALATMRGNDLLQSSTQQMSDAARRIQDMQMKMMPDPGAYDPSIGEDGSLSFGDPEKQQQYRTRAAQIGMSPQQIEQNEAGYKQQGFGKLLPQLDNLGGGAGGNQGLPGVTRSPTVSSAMASGAFGPMFVKQGEADLKNYTDQLGKLQQIPSYQTHYEPKYGIVYYTPSPGGSQGLTDAETAKKLAEKGFEPPVVVSSPNGKYNFPIRATDAPTTAVTDDGKVVRIPSTQQMGAGPTPTPGGPTVAPGAPGAPPGAPPAGASVAPVPARSPIQEATIKSQVTGMTQTPERMAAKIDEEGPGMTGLGLSTAQTQEAKQQLAAGKTITGTNVLSNFFTNAAGILSTIGVNVDPLNHKQIIDQIGKLSASAALRPIFGSRATTMEFKSLGEAKGTTDLTPKALAEMLDWTEQMQRQRATSFNLRLDRLTSHPGYEDYKVYRINDMPKPMGVQMPGSGAAAQAAAPSLDDQVNKIKGKYSTSILPSGGNAGLIPQ